MADRILTTHAGSLPRPADLLELVLAEEGGEGVDHASLAASVRSAVEATVRRQLEIGVDLVNDGELGKPSFATYVKDRLTGFGGESSVEEFASAAMGLDDSAGPSEADEFPDFDAQAGLSMEPMTKIRLAACDGPVSFTGRAELEADVEILESALGGHDRGDAFMSAASPGVIALFSPNRYYPSEDEYLEAVAEAMREEYEAIHAAGLLLQLDCPDLAATPPGGVPLEAFRRERERNVELLNHAVANIPAEAMRMHVCWGNGEWPRTHDVELKDIIDVVLAAKPAGIMLMASNARHAHEWAVFEDVALPDGKYVVAGVLDSVSNVVEHPEVVAQRLERYAGVIGRENVMAGTDCGFGSIAGMQVVAPSVVWAKFESMVAGARLASRRLWR